MDKPDKEYFNDCFIRSKFRKQIYSIPAKIKNASGIILKTFLEEIPRVNREGAQTVNPKSYDLSSCGIRCGVCDDAL